MLSLRQEWKHTQTHTLVPCSYICKEALHLLVSLLVNTFQIEKKGGGKKKTKTEPH